MRLLRTIFGDVHIKLIALFVAAIIWLYAVLERNQTATMDLPITLGRIPSGMAVASIDTGRTRAQLSGKGRDLMLLRLRHPTFRLNLSSENPGRTRVKLTQEQSNLPPSVQVISARPEFVNIDLDQQARRLVKVNVPTRGRPDPGFIATVVRVADNVYLTGPQEEIGQIGTVSTESLSLSDLNAPTERRLRLLPLPGRQFRLEPDSATVTVRIEREETRTFAGVALNVFKPSTHSVTVKPAQAQISVAGAADVVRNLTLQDISATLKITDSFPKGKRRMPIEITLPPGVTLAKCDPSLFDVEIR